MSAATDRQWAVRDAVLRWLLAKTTEGYLSPIVDADAIGEEVGWAASALTPDEVSDAANHLYKEGYATGMPVRGIGIPRPRLTLVGRRAAKTGTPLRSEVDAREAKSRKRLISSGGEVVS
ncbi:serine recombinase [Rhodococcus opacus]|uniref:Serine recombinase n=2 Tax=Rhodococcus TaxID=1827 RepID=A0ABT4NL77_RHOOP|nr:MULTISPECIES: serine recombinase [Rhodococcus]MCZ4588135.1 serine recombinase [Rhodococcus opacus]MDX5969843.1 serine recombinase [Rhodococcus opacus]QSE87248.1 serine recombinase [Rhodococcus pseudokoreensis]CAG7635517.1 hypothetical protein E143388_07686 [Rhodococcus opacus]